MHKTFYQIIKRSALPFLTIITLITTMNLFLGFSESLPDGVFNLMIAALMGIFDILWYWAERETNNQSDYN